MSKKVIWVIIVIIIILGGAGITAYTLFHKTPTVSSDGKPVIIQTKTASNVGGYLADKNGSPLYTYNKDTQGVSNCSGACLLGWPVYAPDGSSQALPTNLTIITRSDDTKQYAYKGLPLYTFSGDVNGNVSGDGVSGFAVAKP